MPDFEFLQLSDMIAGTFCWVDIAKLATSITPSTVMLPLDGFGYRRYAGLETSPVFVDRRGVGWRKWTLIAGGGEPGFVKRFTAE